MAAIYVAKIESQTRIPMPSLESSSFWDTLTKFYKLSKEKGQSGQFTIYKMEKDSRGKYMEIMIGVELYRVWM